MFCTGSHSVLPFLGILFQIYPLFGKETVDTADSSTVFGRDCVRQENLHAACLVDGEARNRAARPRTLNMLRDFRG